MPTWKECQCRVLPMFMTYGLARLSAKVHLQACCSFILQHHDSQFKSPRFHFHPPSSTCLVACSFRLPTTLQPTARCCCPWSGCCLTPMSSLLPSGPPGPPTGSRPGATAWQQQALAAGRQSCCTWQCWAGLLCWTSSALAKTHSHALLQTAGGQSVQFAVGLHLRHH